MEFVISFDMSTFMNELRDFLDRAVKPTLDQTRSLTGNQRARNVAAHIFQGFTDALVDRMHERGGEEIEMTCADYYFARAVAAFLGGHRQEVRSYYDKATAIRTGGDYNMWADAFLQGQGVI